MSHDAKAKPLVEANRPQVRIEYLQANTLQSDCVCCIVDQAGASLLHQASTLVSGGGDQPADFRLAPCVVDTVDRYLSGQRAGIALTDQEYEVVRFLQVTCVPMPMLVRRYGVGRLEPHSDIIGISPRQRQWQVVLEQRDEIEAIAFDLKKRLFQGRSGYLAHFPTTAAIRATSPEVSPRCMGNDSNLELAVRAFGQEPEA